MNDSRKPMSRTRKGGLVAVIGASAAAILTPLVATWEGKRNDPYHDIAGILTVCYGDTHGVVPGKRVTDAECSERLERQLIEHARPVLKCTPGLRDRPEALAAAVSLAYNIGPAGYCRSSVARRFNAGNIRGACDAFLLWNKARIGGRLQPVRGLTNRRSAEREICLRSVYR